MKKSKKGLEKKTKGKFFTIYYECQLISTEIGVISHGAFFKQCSNLTSSSLRFLMAPKG